VQNQSRTDGIVPGIEGHARTVITDLKALYYGIPVNDQSLTPGDHPRLGPTRFEDWLRHKAVN
jgi:hypothetical protein